MSSNPIVESMKNPPVLTRPGRENNARLRARRQWELDKKLAKIKAQKAEDDAIERFISVPK